jgi:hypothetical protein
MPSVAQNTIKPATRVARPLSLYEWLTWLNEHTSAAIAVLIGINLLCHWQTLGGYYLADDFVHVAYLKEVFSGHPELLLKNFYTTWLQTEGTNFYRPFISVTLAFDRLLFGSSPMGYHITNFVYQCLSTIGLYLVAKECLLRFRPSNEDPLRETVFDGNNIYGAAILPILAAMLFAVHPLHAEVVGWIIARVDSVCCAFYLLAMWLFLKSRRLVDAGTKRMCRALAFVFFVISLISKEMAVTLPPALVLLMVLFPERNPDGNKTSPFTAIKKAFSGTWQLWLILVVYAVIRTLALGSVTGGYQGSIGEGLSTSTLERVLSVPSMQRVAFPLNAEVFTPLKRLVRPLAIMYGVAFALFIARLFVVNDRLRVFKIVAFAALWFLLVMVPTIPVWNLTESLQGSRFIYMGTAPLCLFIAALLTPIWTQIKPTFANTSATPLNEISPKPQPTDSEAADLGNRTNPAVQPQQVSSLVVAHSGVAAALAIAVVVFYGIIAFGNNSAWVHAGAELRTLRDALNKHVQTLPQTDRVALLNLPHKFKGAHMLYNAATMSVLLAPPLNETDIVKRVITFEPVLFGDDDLIRASRVRKMLAPGSGTHFVYWDRDNEKLLPLDLKLADAEIKLDQNCSGLKPIDIDARGNAIEKPGENRSAEVPTSSAGWAHQVRNDVQLLAPALDVQPAAADFLDLCLSAKFDDAGTAHGSIPVVVKWTGDLSVKSNEPQNLITTVPTDGKIYRMRIHVSEHKKWFSRGQIHRIAIESPQPGAIVAVHGMSLVNGKHEIPTLEPTGKNFFEDESGVVRAGGKVGRFNFDAKSVNGANRALFEISKPDAWFEHYTNTYRDSAACPRALKSWTSQALQGRAQEFDLKQLSGAGFYELRMAAVGPDGEVVGYFSDPIMFQLSH